MATELRMPKLGVEMVSGRVAKWLKTEGSMVAEGEAIVVIETEKITYEVESPVSGYLHIVCAEGAEGAVGTLLSLIAVTEEEYQELVRSTPGKEPAVMEPVTDSAAPIVAEEPMEGHDERAVGPRKPASPVARRLAAEYGLDINMITGSGPGGRITKEDVLQAMAAKKEEEDRLGVTGGTTTIEAAPPSQGIPVKPVPLRESPLKRLREVVPLQGMRRVISERMFTSLQTTAQMTEMGEIDVTELVALRDELLTLRESMGLEISYTDLLVKAVSIVLKEQPVMNASCDGEQIYFWEDINVGVAVALDDGLVVPVVHHADQKSVGEISRELHSLIDRTRNSSLLLDDVSGGTFTITNFGSYGAWLGTPVLNPPEMVILGVGVIQEKPVVREHQIVVRWMMGYSLTVDHRIIDGATGGKFIKRLLQLLAQPKSLLVY